MKLAAYMMFVVALAGIACLVGNVSQYELDDTDSTINYLGPGTYGWDNEDIIYQPAMHMIAGIILMIFFPFFYFKLNGKAVEIDMDMITPADFTVWIKGLPSDYNDEELKNWI